MLCMIGLLFSAIVMIEATNKSRNFFSDNLEESKETWCQTADGLVRECPADCPSCPECTNQCNPDHHPYTALNPEDTSVCGENTLLCQESWLAGILFNKKKCGRDAADVMHGSWPWVVGIYRVQPWLLWKRRQFRCVGVILHKKYVLTSAHCFHDSLDKSKYEVRLGIVTLSRNLPAMSLKRITVHPSYVKGMFLHDLAVIEVAERRRMNDVRPVCLPVPSFQDGGMQDVNASTLTGWGAKPHESGPFMKYSNSDAFQVMRLEMKPIDECERIYKESNPHDMHRFFSSLITDQHFICAESPEDYKQESCQASKRGPLTVASDDGNQRTVLVGLFTAGSVECEGSLPTLYTRISPYLDWIKEKTTL